MVTLVRTNSENSDFIQLVKLLDAELAVRDGAEHSFYSQFNKIDTIRYVIVAYQDSIPTGCGAIKEFSPEEVEIKRMFVQSGKRHTGIASKILSALEQWARELNYKKCILETGKRQPEAIALYTKNGFSRIPNYGQYKGIGNSLCFEKTLS